MAVVNGNEGYKEVYFNQYCLECKHGLVPMTEEPCNECLDNPVQLYSHKPINFEEKDD